MNKDVETISFFNTHIDKDAFLQVQGTLESTYVSEGKKVKQFEKELEKELNLSYPVTVNSGTSALHLSLILSGIKSGDEVLIPAQTFIATGLVVLQLNAIPVFVDIDYSSGNMNPDDLKRKITNKSKALIPVHWGGLPCDMEAINNIAKDHNLIVIEDAAHALGAEYKSIPIGRISDFTCFSFQAIKHLTTGDGGAISFINYDKSEEAKRRRWFGLDRTNSRMSDLGERDFNVSELGFKYHLNDLSASLGLSNLKSFKNRLSYIRKIADEYKLQLANLSGLKLLTTRNAYDFIHAYWLFGMHVEKRNDFIKYMREKNIPVSVVHQGIDKNDIFRPYSTSLPEQRAFDQTQIHIPIHENLNWGQVEFIIESIKNGW
jgi:perosamine synthetase